MRNGFIAYHGSQYNGCGDLEDDYEGRYDTAIFFSLDPSMALEFSKGAEIRHYCTYEIPYSLDQIFNPEDDYALESLQDCLLDRIENKDLVSQTIAGIAAFDWGEFNPASWVGGVVKQCLLEMGYVGWFEKEDGSDVLNIGLYSAKGVKLLRVDYFCDDCEAPLATSPRGSLICENCEQDLCPECGTEIEWDEDDEEWVQGCTCDIDDVFVPFQKHSKEDKRVNPKPRPWLPEVDGEYVYHVTHRSHLPSIQKYGLVTEVPEDMPFDTKAVYVFPSEDDMQTALGQWFGERIGDLIEEGIYTDDWVCLGVMLEGIDWDNCISDVGYEIAILHTVEPQYIRVLDIPV